MPIVATTDPAIARMRDAERSYNEFNHVRDEMHAAALQSIASFDFDYEEPCYDGAYDHVMDVLRETYGSNDQRLIDVMAAVADDIASGY